MKVIIAGSRNISGQRIICEAIQAFGFEITEVVSGGARGVDESGEIWAKNNNIPIKLFPALWDWLEAPNCKVVERPDGSKYNLFAGFNRNQEMADYAEALIAIKNPHHKTNGTNHMIERAKANGLRIYIHKIRKNETTENQTVFTGL